MNAWPALEQVLLDGWVLRAAAGYTKRANSANPTYPAISADLADKIAQCEAFYAARGLPAIFRLTSFGCPPGLDKALADRGYERLDETLVLTRRLAPVAELEGRAFVELPIDAWLPAYVAFSKADPTWTATHEAMLRAIPGVACFGALISAEDVVAVGLAVREGPVVGCFDLVVDPNHRRCGHGRELMLSLMAWGAAQGATSGYLQVVAANNAAISLYAGLGFGERYRYWYRRSPP